MRQRGGWNNHSLNLRAANRNNNAPDNHNDNLGFRLATHPTRPARCHTVARARGGSADWGVQASIPVCDLRRMPNMPAAASGQ